MPIPIRISVSLTFTTPPSVGEGGTRGTLADKVVTRDAEGRFIIPGSQVKGKLRHACEQLLRAGGVPLCRPPQPDQMCPAITHDALAGAPSTPFDLNKRGLPCCLLCQIFGSPADRSRLHFQDLRATQSNLPAETLRTMVSLNRKRRVAEEQRLFFFETAPNFRGLEFACETAVTGFLAQEEHLHIVLAGFELLYTWGGGASRGLGWGDGKAEASLPSADATGAGETPASVAPAVIRLDIEKVRPLCPNWNL